MIHDAAAVVDQTRLIWKSELPITVAHCGELNFEAIRMFREHNNSPRVLSVFDCATARQLQVKKRVNRRIMVNKWRPLSTGLVTIVL